MTPNYDQMNEAISRIDRTREAIRDLRRTARVLTFWAFVAAVELGVIVWLLARPG